MKKIIINFGDQTDKQAVVEQVLNQLNADYRILQDHELGQRVGTLLGLDGFTQTPDTTNTHHSIDLMLFEEAADEDILQLNTLLQAAGTEMKRKAMLTEHNRHWRFHDLLTEIEREHTYFQMVDAIRTLLVQSSELIIEDYTPASWSAYEKAFYQAYDCINKECSLEEISTAYHALSDAKKQLQRNE